MPRLPLVLAALAGALVSAPSAGAIYHGAPVTPAEAPWSVALTSRSLACGGALIAPDRVLTAAHCVQGVNPAKLRVRLGGGRWEPGEAARTIGRGRTGPLPAGTTDAPFAAAQQVLDPSACAKAYTSLYDPAIHLCTQDLTPTAAQACSGDSGSPVLVQRAGGPAAAGVVSWGGETQGRDCGQGLPDVSAAVAAYAPLLTGAAPARLAPYALRRVRVRRRAATLRCVIGDWKPSGATFSVRWWRRTTRGRQIGVSGTRRTRHASSTAKLGCSATARTAGGWATEDSYNLL